MKYLKSILISLLFLLFANCTKESTFSNIKTVSAMRNAMWKGELGAKIKLDTIQNKTNLYGIGPLSYLTGEITIANGKSYVSKVTSDSTMLVTETFNVSAPFFVYTNVKKWNSIKIPPSIKSILDIESFLDSISKDIKHPFAFKLSGEVAHAKVHIQNLPEGTKVSSPKEAHQGQTNYSINNTEVEVVGFFSTTHQGVFTHHDSFVHMHLISKDRKTMGHLDDIKINKMELLIPHNPF